MLLLLHSPLQSSAANNRLNPSMFMKLTLTNVRDGSHVMWVHCVFVFLFTGYACWLLKWHYHQYVIIRQHYMQQGDNVNVWRHLMDEQAEEAQEALRQRNPFAALASAVVQTQRRIQDAVITPGVSQVQRAARTLGLAITAGAVGAAEAAGLHLRHTHSDSNDGDANNGDGGDDDSSAEASPQPDVRVNVADGGDQQAGVGEVELSLSEASGEQGDGDGPVSAPAALGRSSAAPPSPSPGGPVPLMPAATSPGALASLGSLLRRRTSALRNASGAPSPVLPALPEQVQAQSRAATPSHASRRQTTAQLSQASPTGHSRQPYGFQRTSQGAQSYGMACISQGAGGMGGGGKGGRRFQSIPTMRYRNQISPNTPAGMPGQFAHPGDTTGLAASAAAAPAGVDTASRIHDMQVLDSYLDKEFEHAGNNLFARASRQPLAFAAMLGRCAGREGWKGGMPQAMRLQNPCVFVAVCEQLCCLRLMRLTGKGSCEDSASFNVVLPLHASAGSASRSIQHRPQTSHKNSSSSSSSHRKRSRGCRISSSLRPLPPRCLSAPPPLRHQG